MKYTVKKLYKDYDTIFFELNNIPYCNVCKDYRLLEKILKKLLKSYHYIILTKKIQSIFDKLFAKNRLERVELPRPIKIEVDITPLKRFTKSYI